MPEHFFLAFGLGLAASCAEILGGWVIARQRSVSLRVQEYLLALGAGFILALVFTELIPESFKTLHDSAALYILSGYAALHFFEHAFVRHLHFGEETHGDVMISKVASFSALAGLLIHAFFDGLSISAGIQFSKPLGILIFLAVLLHKFPEGVTAATILIASRHGRKRAFSAALIIAAATMVGIVTVFIISGINQQLIGTIFAFSAGAAVYVGASDLIPEVNHSRNRIIPIIVFAGMILFYISSRWVDAIMK